VSSEASCSLSSPESTFNSQESSSSLTSKVVYSERQSWLDLVNSSATEEGDQPLTFCVQIHSDEPPEVDSEEAAESEEIQLPKSSGGSPNSFLDPDTHCLAVPDATGQRSLAKGEIMKVETFVCRAIHCGSLGFFLNFLSPSFLYGLH